MPMREPLTRLSDQRAVTSCCKRNLLLLFGLADKLLTSKNNLVSFSKICQEPIIQLLHLQEYVSPSEPKLPIQVPSKGNTDISVALDEPNREVKLYLWSVKGKANFGGDGRERGPQIHLTSHIDPYCPWLRSSLCSFFCSSFVPRASKLKVEMYCTNIPCLDSLVLILFSGLWTKRPLIW